MWGDEGHRQCPHKITALNWARVKECSHIRARWWGRHTLQYLSVCQRAGCPLMPTGLHEDCAEPGSRGSRDDCSGVVYRTRKALGPSQPPQQFCPHHAIPWGWGLCPATTPCLRSPDPLSQPTSLPLLSQIQSAASPSIGPFSLARYPCP